MTDKKGLNNWIKGVGYETAFWNNVFRWKHTYNGLMQWSNYGDVISLEGFDANEFLLKHDTPRVLDVGCGMSYATGDFINRDGEKEKLDIHYVDFLAVEFNKILKRHKRQLPEIEFGMMEYLSVFFDKVNPHLIVIQNALDHSSQPVKSIIEAIRVLPLGGTLYLNHHPNEAETEKYKGFHQFNVNEKDGNLIIWNKEDETNVNQLVDGFADIEVKRHENGHIIAIITKVADVPQSIVDDKKDMCEMCNAFLAESLKSSSISRSIALKSKYCFFNITQFFAQALPWSLKMKVKKLIGQA